MSVQQSSSSSNSIRIISQTLIPENMSAMAVDVTTKTSSVYHEVKKKYPGIRECQCGDFSRDKKCRMSLEDALVKDIKKQFPDKNAEIRLCSVGAGGCYQELVILSKLIKAGYTNIHITLIDPSYTQEVINYESCTGGMNSVKQLEKYIHDELGAGDKIKVHAETDFDKFLRKVEKDEAKAPNAFLMIDIQSTIIEHGDDKGLTVLDHTLKQIKTSSKIPADTICAFTKVESTATLAALPTKRNLNDGSYEKFESNDLRKYYNTHMEILADRERLSPYAVPKLTIRKIVAPQTTTQQS